MPLNKETKPNHHNKISVWLEEKPPVSKVKKNAMKPRFKHTARNLLCKRQNSFRD